MTHWCYSVVVVELILGSFDMERGAALNPLKFWTGGILENQANQMPRHRATGFII